MVKSSKIPIYYWDACVFLAGITGEAGRQPIVESILEKCEDGSVLIHTSVLSITEVSFSKVEKNNKKLDEDIESAIEELWAPSSKIRIADFNEVVAIRAKDIIRRAISRGWSIKPADAIHLATAMGIGVDEFHTHDKPIINKNKKELQEYLGFSITEPHKEPSLFDELNEDQEHEHE